MSEGAKIHRLRPPAGGRDVELWVVGLNHRSAPVELRERLAFPEATLGDASLGALDCPGLREAVVLSTCNRVEVVMAAERGVDILESITDFLAREGTVSRAAVAEHLYVHRGKNALRHLLRVASSLDSLVVGEPQILGQLKSQFRHAADSGAVKTTLRRCFERAFSVGKRVRSETGIATKAVSVASTAVDLARRIFDDLRDKTAMLIGVGKMGELAARHLVRHGIASVIVTNRSFDRAVELARGFGGTAVPFDHFLQQLPLADVVLGSVSADGYLLGPSQLHEVLRARRRRPMFFIDLGVPRNFDPAINELESVYLYNIDDLASVADDNRAERDREAARAEAIVEEEVERLWRSLGAGDLTPTIVALRSKLEGIRRGELDRALGVLRALAPEERGALEAMTQAIVNKIVHLPVATLKRAALEEEDEAMAEIAELVHRLFALEVEADPDDENGEPGGS